MEHALPGPRRAHQPRQRARARALTARLTHLGFLGAYDAVEAEAAHDPASLQSAVEAFQRDRSLPPTGRLDLETLDALLRRHGS